MFLCVVQRFDGFCEPILRRGGATAQHLVIFLGVATAICWEHLNTAVYTDITLIVGIPCDINDFIL